MKPDKNEQKFSHWQRKIAMFLGGQTVSLFGSSLVQYAILWHLTLTTQSGVIITLASIFGFLPQAIISLFAGVWADRYSRKILVMLTDGIIAAVTLVLAIFSVSGSSELWVIFVVLAIRSLGAGVQTPAVAALIPQIVPKKELMKINGLNGSIQSIIMFASPVVAGAIYGVARDITPILFIDVVTAAIGISIVALIKVPRLIRTIDEKGYFDEIKAGFRYMRSHEMIRKIYIFFAIFSVFVVPAVYLTPLMVTRVFGDVTWHIDFQIFNFSVDQVWRLTANEVAFSIGMAIGGAVIAMISKNKIMKNRVASIAASAIIFGVLSILMGALSHIFLVYLLVIVSAGMIVALNNAASMTLFQEKVAPDMQGRMFSVMGIVWALAMPLGMAIIGPLADVVSIELLLIITGVLIILLGFGLFRDKIARPSYQKEHF